MFDKQSKQVMFREILRVKSGSDDGFPEQRNREIGTNRPPLIKDKDIPKWVIKIPKGLLQEVKILYASS